MKQLITAMLLLAISAQMAFALDDTPDNREREAVRYMLASPLSEMMADMSQQLAMNLPPDRRKAFKDLMTRHLDLIAVEKAMKAALIKHFTADELSALADFYGSESGKSAMKHFGVYMADVMPVIQAEVIKAQTKANREAPDDASDEP